MNPNLLSQIQSGTSLKKATTAETSKLERGTAHRNAGQAASITKPTSGTDFLSELRKAHTRKANGYSNKNTFSRSTNPTLASALQKHVQQKSPHSISRHVMNAPRLRPPSSQVERFEVHGETKSQIPASSKVLDIPTTKITVSGSHHLESPISVSSPVIPFDYRKNEMEDYSTEDELDLPPPPPFPEDSNEVPSVPLSERNPYQREGLLEKSRISVFLQCLRQKSACFVTQLFRKPSHQQDIEKVLHALKISETMSFSTLSIQVAHHDVFVLSNALKAYFRQHDPPHLCYDLYPHFLACCKSEIEEVDRISKRLKKVFQGTSGTKLALRELLDLKALLSFLEEIEEVDREMLSYIWAPSLFRPRVESLQTLSRDAKLAKRLVHILITNHRDILSQEYLSKRLKKEQRKQRKLMHATRCRGKPRH